MRVSTGNEVIDFPDSMQRDEIRAALVQRNNSNVVDYMRTVASVETAGLKEPFVRVKDENAPPEGSTAYGPLQVTLRLARDYRDRKAKLFDSNELEYLDRFVEQGKKFSEFGREPSKKGYDPKYEYGAKGDLGDSKEDRDMYWQVMSKLFKDKLGGDYSAENVSRNWHGGTDEKNISNYADKLRSAGLQ